MLEGLIGTINNFDFSLFYFINVNMNNYILTLIMPLISEIGVMQYWIIFCVLFYFIGGEKAKSAAILCLIVVIISFYGTEILKIIFQRPRPYMVHQGVNLLSIIGPSVFNITSYSFPSGHSAVIFAACTVFGKIYGRLYIFIPLAFLVGFSRIYLGVHYPLDVIFGALLGISISLLILRYENQIISGLDKIVHKIKSSN